MKPLVSVIIPNHNYGRFLAETIASVQSQTYQRVEIIVVDNGSTDNSREVLENFGKEISTFYQDNMGQANARNKAISEARGEVIALLDADDYWERDKLAAQISQLTAEIQFVYTGFRKFESERGSTIETVYPVFEGDCSMAFIEHPSRSIVPGGESSAIFTRQLVNRVGKFNPELNSASGRDFFRRCSRFTNFFGVQRPLMNYRIHESNMSKKIESMILDTSLAHELLFKDPSWHFALPYQKSSFNKLYWSFTKATFRHRKYTSSLKHFLWILSNPE